MTTYTINFRVTKRLFNLFNIRLFQSILVDIEESDQVNPRIESVDEVKSILEEYCKIKKVSNPTIISYWREIS